MTDWDDGASGYQRSFARLCAGTTPFLLGGIADAPGTRLLEAGCGTGEVAAAARDVGFDVTGVDASERMLELAAASHPGIRFASADLTALTLDDHSFDAATANFVINHTADPRRALRELHRILRPTGVASITIWPYRVSELNSVWSEVLERSGAQKPPIERLPHDKDFARTIEGLTRLMTEAHFTDVQSTEVEWVFRITPDDLWSAAESGMAIIGTTYLSQSESMRERMTEAFRVIVEPATSEGLLHFRSTAILGGGRA